MVGTCASLPATEAAPKQPMDQPDEQPDEPPTEVAQSAPDQAAQELDTATDPPGGQVEDKQP